MLSECGIHLRVYVRIRQAQILWIAFETLNIWLAAELFPGLPYGEVCEVPLRFLAGALGMMTEDYQQ